MLKSIEGTFDVTRKSKTTGGQFSSPTTFSYTEQSSQYQGPQKYIYADIDSEMPNSYSYSSPGGKAVAAVKMTKIKVELQWQGGGTPTKTCYIVVDPSAYAYAGAAKSASPGIVISASNGLGSEAAAPRKYESDSWVESAVDDYLPARKIISIETGGATWVKKELDLTLEANASLITSGSSYGNNGQVTRARATVATFAEMSQDTFSIVVSPHSPYFALKYEADDKELDAFAKLGWKDDGVAEHPLIPFYQGTTDFAVTATRSGQTLILRDYKWTASPETYVPLLPVADEWKRDQMVPDVSTSNKQFHWQFGDDPAQLPKDSKVTVSATDPNDGAQLKAKATIHWHWAFEGAGGGDAGAGGADDPTTFTRLPGALVTMAPVRDDSLTQHQPAPKPIEQVQVGERILLPGQSTLPHIVTSKETLPDGTVILHLGISPDDNPDDPAFDSTEQANRFHDACLEAQYTGAKHVGTGLKAYKALAEFYAYGPFYNLGGAVLVTMSSKVTELLALAAKEEQVAAEAGALAGKARALVTKLRQGVGEAKTAEEAAALTQKAARAEKEATQLEAGAAEAQSLAAQSRKIGEEAQSAIEAVKEAQAFHQTSGGVPVFRVQGGIVPNASEVRFVVEEGGNLSIVGEKMIWINVGDESRALEFWAKRGDTAEIVHFLVNPSFVKELEAVAVRQFKGIPAGVPQIGDWTKAAHQYGLPSTWFQKLLDSVVSGSVTTIRLEN